MRARICVASTARGSSLGMIGREDDARHHTLRAFGCLSRGEGREEKALIVIRHPVVLGKRVVDFQGSVLLVNAFQLELMLGEKTNDHDAPPQHRPILLVFTRLVLALTQMQPGLTQPRTPIGNIICNAQ